MSTRQQAYPKRIRLNSPYGKQAILDGCIVRGYIWNGTVGDVVREEPDHALIVDWPQLYRTVVPQHWYEVVE